MHKQQLLKVSILLLLGSCTYLPEHEFDNPEVLINETRDYIELKPARNDISNTGFIFYPGGLVDPHAYEDWATDFALSGKGHQVIIAKMPANLAVLESKAARKIAKKFPARQWVIGGHSLGGAMACTMVEKEEELFRGLILMAAYSAQSVDLSAWNGVVISITASKDEVLDWQTFEEGKKRLPLATQFMEITGGNHSGFGSYGYQEGDGEADISREEQQEQIVELIQNFYQENGLE